MFSMLTSTNTDVEEEETNPKDIRAWSCDMDDHAQKCVERFYEWARKTVDQLQKVSTLFLDDHQVNSKCERLLSLILLRHLGSQDELYKLDNFGW